MKVLILKAKHGDYPVFARDEEEELRAYLLLFKIMEKWGCYDGRFNSLDAAWYNNAYHGDAQAARCLLQYRSNRKYEYETIEEIYPEVPK